MLKTIIFWRYQLVGADHFQSGHVERIGPNKVVKVKQG